MAVKSQLAIRKGTEQSKGWVLKTVFPGAPWRAYWMQSSEESNGTAIKWYEEYEEFKARGVNWLPQMLCQNSKPFHPWLLEDLECLTTEATWLGTSKSRQVPLTAGQHHSLYQKTSEPNGHRKPDIKLNPGRKSICKQRCIRTANLCQK